MAIFIKVILNYTILTNGLKEIKMSNILPQIKYTANGKKVRVVGQLNSTEYIVQEIFVDDKNNEIPAGENFVTKNLLDSPSKSWQEKHHEEWSEKVKSKEHIYEDMCSKIDRKKVELDAIEAKAYQANCTLKSLEGFDFSHFVRVFTGKVKYACSQGEVKTFDDEIIRTDRRYTQVDFDSLRLITLCGNTKGNLVYRISEYGDGSGSSKNTIFVETTEEAGQYLVDYARGNYINGNCKYSIKSYIERIKELGLTVPNDLIEYEIEFRKKDLAARKAKFAESTDRETERLNIIEQEVESFIKEAGK